MMAAKCINLGPSCIGTKTSNMGKKTFDKIVSNEFKKTEAAAYMLDETRKQLEKKYPTVYNGTNKTMISIPAQYDFGVEGKGGGKEHKKDERGKQKDKARAMQFGDESLIKDRIDQLKKLPKKKDADTRELHHLEQILKEKRPLSCEASVVLRFRTFFENEPGLCLHSYNPADYLLRFIELAKELRKSFSPTKISQLEKSILRVLNIPMSEIDQWVTEAINKIEIENSKTNMPQAFLISGQTISKALELNEIPIKERKNQNIELKKSFAIFETKFDPKTNRVLTLLDFHGKQKERFYTRSEIIHILYKSEYERMVNCFNDEFDCLVLLTRHRLILGIEAKQAMVANPDTNDKQAKEAAKQVKKREEYIKKTMGELLDNGWRYVRIVALYDHNGTIVQNKCHHCSPYILTNGTETEQKQQMIALFSALTCPPVGGSIQTHSENSEFQHMFSRLVGLSGLFMMVQKVEAYHNIMGTDASGISSGWTKASRMKFGNESDVSRLGDMIGRPHDIFKLIFFNQDQIGILALKHNCVIFLDDYGAGKSLILKEASIRMVVQNEQKRVKGVSTTDVYYIVLTAADEKGKPRNEYFTFDIASKMDMKETNVKVLDSHDLLEMYSNKHGKEAAKDADVYELVEDLIDENTGGSYFVDECPFEKVGTGSGDEYGGRFNETSIEKAENFIQSCRTKLKDDDKLWIAFAPNSLHDFCKADNSFGVSFKNMKENLVKSGVFIKSLTTNMRNTKEVGDVTKKAQSSKPNSFVKVAKNIPALEVRTNVSSSSKPLLIPYVKTKRKQHLKLAMKKAVKRTKEDGQVLVLMFDPHDLDMKQLRDILIKCGEKENLITLHPDKSSDGSIEKLEAFLANPIGTYLVPQDSFTGMEARNIILILSEHDFFHSDDTIFVRCHLSRAVSNLCVIQELKNNQSDYMLPSMDVDGSFLKCCKELKQIAFKFPTQEEDYVCYPCCIVCHQDQTQPEGKFIDRQKTSQCSCAHIADCQLQNNDLRCTIAKLHCMM